MTWKYCPINYLIIEKRYGYASWRKRLRFREEGFVKMMQFLHNSFPLSLKEIWKIEKMIVMMVSLLYHTKRRKTRTPMKSQSSCTTSSSSHRGSGGGDDDGSTTTSFEHQNMANNRAYVLLEWFWGSSMVHLCT